MRHLSRWMMIVFAATLFWGLAGCASTNYEKGMKQFKPADAVEAVRQLKPLAEQGNAEAQFNLGSLYYQGVGVTQDYPQAIQWMYKAAEQGYVPAQVTLGSIYAEGVWGVIEKDNSRALMWFIFASAQGDIQASEFKNNLAGKMTTTEIAQAQSLVKEFRPQHVYTKALDEFKALGEKGDADAQFKAGLIYYRGQGIPPDYAEALNWFSRAAQAGHPLAQFNAGYMYERGEGAPQDHQKAAGYYHQAAQRGNRLAQYNLGCLYEKGHGVSKDEVQALMWYSLSAIQGEGQAREARDRISVWMSPDQVAEAQRRAREFKIVVK